MMPPLSADTGYLPSTGGGVDSNTHPIERISAKYFRLFRPPQLTRFTCSALPISFYRSDSIISALPPQLLYNPDGWDHEQFNRDSSGIAAFLGENHHVGSTSVPHRQNRALLFDSMLFHQSDPFRFKKGKERGQRATFRWSLAVVVVVVLRSKRGCIVCQLSAYLCRAPWTLGGLDFPFEALLWSLLFSVCLYSDPLTLMHALWRLSLNSIK